MPGQSSEDAVMAKRLEPHASRGTARDARKHEEEPPAGPVERLWNRATKTIVGAGAIASAIAAIVSLWPPSDNAEPDLPDRPTFTWVQIKSDVPFSAFQIHVATNQLPEEPPGGLRPWGAAPVAATEQYDPTADPNGGVTDPPPYESDPPTAPPPPSETASTPDINPTAGTASAESSAPDAVEVKPALTPDPASTAATENACAELTSTISEEACRESPIVDLMARSFLRNATGEPDPPDAAKTSLVQIFEDARTTEATEESVAEPLGVVITVKVELAGMRNEPVLLSWSMWNLGATRVHGEWLNPSLAYRLVATTNRDVAELNFWVPLPRTSGSYQLRSHLEATGMTPVTDDSKTFS
jgi:hypothetical protein